MCSSACGLRNYLHLANVTLNFKYMKVIVNVPDTYMDVALSLVAIQAPELAARKAEISAIPEVTVSEEVLELAAEDGKAATLYLVFAIAGLLQAVKQIADKEDEDDKG